MNNDYIAFDPLVEQQVIGAMVRDPEVVTDMIVKIKPDDFYQVNNRVLCKAIFDVYNEAGANMVNEIEIARMLQKQNQDAGGLLIHLKNAVLEVPTAAHIDYYSDDLLTFSQARKLIDAGARISALQPNGRDELEHALAQAETAIASISDETIQEDHLTDAPDMFDRFFDRLDMIREQGNGITGLATGLTDLDAITLGFQKSDLIIIAGRPSMGKTAFALQLAMGMRENGAKGIFFELEMDENPVAARMVARHAHVNSRKLKSGKLTREEDQKLKESRQILQRDYQGMRIDTTPSITISEMKAKARKFKRMGELDFIIVDYLQLITGIEGRSRNEEVGKISHDLKRMARELEVPVIALSQLSRGVEGRQDKRPQLSDLRDSGEIEQDADVVILMYREDYYNEETDMPGIAEAIVAKQRNGTLGTVKTLFKKEFNKFLPLSPMASVPSPPITQEVAATYETGIEDIADEAEAPPLDFDPLNDLFN